MGELALLADRWEVFAAACRRQDFATVDQLLAEAEATVSVIAGFCKLDEARRLAASNHKLGGRLSAGSPTTMPLSSLSSSKALKAEEKESGMKVQGGWLRQEHQLPFMVVGPRRHHCHLRC